MSFTQKLNVNWSGDGGPAINGPVSKSGDAVGGCEMTLANSSTQPLVLALRAAGLQMLYMLSDIAATITFRDAGGTSVGSVALVAGQPYAWWDGNGQTSPISDDVASINVSSAATGSLKIRGLYDGTPVSATVALTGTITSNHAEADIVTGGQTIILTLTNATWVNAGANFNAQRQAIINGLVSAGSETDGWNNDVVPAIAVTAVVRTSSTIVTITLPAVGAYSITTDETITVTVPESATTAAEPLVASPTITITAS